MSKGAYDELVEVAGEVYRAAVGCGADHGNALGDAVKAAAGRARAQALLDAADDLDSTMARPDRRHLYDPQAVAAAARRLRGLAHMGWLPDKPAVCPGTHVPAGTVVGAGEQDGGVTRPCHSDVPKEVTQP